MVFSLTCKQNGALILVPLLSRNSNCVACSSVFLSPAGWQAVPS